MNKKTEKKRCSNFSSFEIDLLIKLVEERRQILRCPKLDAITVEKRNAAWHEITEIFNQNEAVHVYRDEEKLKKKYSNIRCERNKIGKQVSKTGDGMQNNEIAQANDNAVAGIVVKKEKTNDIANSQNNAENATDESNKQKEELTEDCSENFSECDSITDCEDDDSDGDDYETLPYELNDDEKKIQLAANKIAETNNNIAINKSKLELQIIENEHKDRMKFLKMKHDIAMQRIEFQKMKHHLELKLLNVEIAVKRKKKT